MTKLDVNQSLASFVTVDVSATVGQALTKLRNADNDFIMITKEWDEQKVPVSILREAALMRLASEQEQKLEQLLGQFPPILTADEDDLEEEKLSDVLTILGRTESPGLVVRLPNNAFGIISRGTVARAIPLEEIVYVGAERATNQVGVLPRSYICRQCSPERRKPARVGGPPDCDVFSHGEMEEE